MSNIEFKTSKKALFIDGKQITPYEWDEIYVNDNKGKIILASKHNVKVYDIQTKEVVFEKEFVDAIRIHDKERIIVCKENKEAMYSIDGEILIDFFPGIIFGMVDFYRLQVGSKYGIATLDGRNITPVIYNNVTKEGSHIVVELETKKGLFNFNCEMLLEPEYDNIGVFDNYIITVPDKNDICRRQIYTLDGKKLILDCNNVFCISADYPGILVETKDNNTCYSLYSFDGTPILESYSNMEFGDEIADGVIIAAKYGRVGLFDLDGSEILPCKYQRILYGAGSSYESQIVTVIEDNERRAIYSTKERKFVVPFGKYKSIKSYKKGICDLVLENNVHGYYITKADRFIEADDVNITNSGRYEFKINDKWEMLEI